MDYENITERRILVFGDSNTYGYDPERDGRYGETERYPCRIQALLGPGWTVIEEGLPGRTAVFDDPVTEGLCGLSYLTPCMMSHAPLDTLVVMLGTNDTKERFGCNAYLIAQGIGRLLKKAADTDAWRDKPDILAVCLRLLCPHTRVWSSATLWVADVRKRLPLWHRNWSPWFCSWVRAFWTQGACPAWKCIRWMAYT